MHDPDADMITVVLVDDDHLVRSGLRMILDSTDDIVVVGEAGDGAEGVDVIRRERPAIALVDVRMPLLDGIETARRVAQDAAGTRVIILTTFEQDQYVFDALRAGASGFLLKRTPPEDLIAAIQVVAAGDALLSPSVTQRLIKAFVTMPAEPQGTVDLSHLTERERQVLIAMATGDSNAAIGARLYISEETVRTHVKRVLRKLDLRDRAQAIVFAYESGLVRPGSS